MGWHNLLKVWGTFMSCYYALFVLYMSTDRLIVNNDGLYLYTFFIFTKIICWKTEGKFALPVLKSLNFGTADVNKITMRKVNNTVYLIRNFQNEVRL